eukprot:2544326-Rhodomonas_salina.1
MADPDWIRGVAAIKGAVQGPQRRAGSVGAVEARVWAVRCRGMTRGVLRPGPEDAVAAPAEDGPRRRLDCFCSRGHWRGRVPFSRAIKLGGVWY